ncbi:MAG: hypothetical protein SWE60_25400, partial [Thermodesulfobacteriota bacterium]|nr:hypothetical protein [Thermodesulfobacteriota bacterium]
FALQFLNRFAGHVGLKPGNVVRHFYAIHLDFTLPSILSWSQVKRRDASRSPFAATGSIGPCATTILLHEKA